MDSLKYLFQSIKNQPTNKPTYKQTAMEEPPPEGSSGLPGSWGKNTGPLMPLSYIHLSFSVEHTRLTACTISHLHRGTYETKFMLPKSRVKSPRGQDVRPNKIHTAGALSYNWTSAPSNCKTSKPCMQDHSPPLQMNRALATLPKHPNCLYKTVFLHCR